MNVLIVEDEKSLADLVAKELASTGFSIDTVALLSDARRRFETRHYDGVVLDLGLPDGNGLDLLTTIRENGDGVPVLVLSARDSTHSKVNGLDRGADDYLGKPFEMIELVARMKALLRRSGAVSGAALVVGNITLDPARDETRINGVIADLTKRERELLEQLMRRTDRIATRSELEKAIGCASSGSGATSIEVLVHRLRRRLLAYDTNTTIKTFRGVGYMLSERRAVSVSSSPVKGPVHAYR